MKQYFFSLVVLFLIASCNSNQKNGSNRKSTKPPIAQTMDSTNAQNKAIERDSLPAPLPEPDFLKTLKVQHLPYRDSTNFDNHTDQPQMRDTEIEQLKLKSRIPDGFNFKLNHKLAISQQFHAIVISYYVSDNELYTALITYNKDYNIIDLLDIAFDEVAESWFRIESTVHKDHIVLEHFDYTDNAPKVTITDYKIEPNGTFAKVETM